MMNDFFRVWYFDAKTNSKRWMDVKNVATARAAEDYVRSTRLPHEIKIGVEVTEHNPVFIDIIRGTRQVDWRGA